ncbi:hypothetical protein BKA56DRAFT_602260 [Ilyonectria sp. MPI-CAGE-AT-0026]|nr:hypothetical protein BKA56DRAFT_602260 [Ilyonectria sp. MPI-CAGE-AT-0026]
MVVCTGSVPRSQPRRFIVVSVASSPVHPREAGSAFTSNAIVPEDSFKVTEGTLKFYDVTDGSGRNNRHFFCADCGPSLYTKPDIFTEKIAIKGGGLDGGVNCLGSKISVEFYTQDRAANLSALDGAKQQHLLG